MKITQEMHTKLDTAKKNFQITSDSKQSFNQIVQSQAQQMKQKELTRLMENIDAQGERLLRHRSFRDLATFKRLVKSFLKEAVTNGLDLEKSHHFSYTGSSRQLAIIKEVDQKLLELTDEVLSEEQKGVDLLGMIGEIKGLLVNIYI